MPIPRFDVRVPNRKPPATAVLQPGHGLASGLVGRWLFSDGAGYAVRSLRTAIPDHQSWQ